MNSLLRLLGLSGDSADSIVEYAWKFAHPLPTPVLYALLGIGAVLAAVNFLPQIKMRTPIRVWTFLLRLAMLAVLLATIQQLELHLRLKLQQKQNWLAVVDDSASMATRDVDGKSRFEAARADLERIKALADGDVKLDVRTLSGAPLGEQPGKGPTFVQKGIGHAALAASGVDRIVFLTDGRDTEGRDLTQLGKDIRGRGIELAVKLYGASVRPADSSIFAEPERPVIRLGEELVVRGSVLDGSDAKAAGQAVPVTLKENGKAVAQITVPGGKPGESRQFIVTWKPPKAGRYVYTVELPNGGHGADALPMNNAYNFKVQVVEEKIKVLLLEGWPRYEFKLVKMALEVDPLVHLVSVCHIPGGGVYVQGKPFHLNPQEGIITSQAELFKYDVVILRDLSRQYFRAGGDISESRLRNIVEFVAKRGGGLMVTGGQDVYRAGGYEDSALAEILPFDLSDHFSKEAQFEGMFFASIPKAAYNHPIMRLFAEAAKNKERWESLRELDGSNNVGRFKPLATPLITRFVKVKTSSGDMVEHEVPIMAYQAVGEGKVVAAAVDTLWRWQLQPEFEDPPLQALLANVVRYVAPPPMSKAGGMNVALADASPQVGQEVVLSTMLKDKNFDPIRNADIVVTVTRPDGTTQHIYPRDLPEQPGYYEYKVEASMPGEFAVSAVYGKEEYETSFMVEASGSEFADLSSDKDAMVALTKAAEGAIIDSTESWLRTVNTRSSTREAVRDLQAWNSPMALLLFLGLVCVDCYIRKRQGLV